MARSTSKRQSARIARRRHPFWRLVRANFYDLGLLLRESWISLAGFAVVAAAGTLYLALYQGLSFAAAFYETLKLLTLQSGLEFPPDLLGEALFFVLPLLGLALIFQSVLNFGRLLLDKGSRREAWQVALASTYRDHVIVCGLGRVGLRVVTQLLESGHAPVVIEREWDSEFVTSALGLKVPVISGDARVLATLRQARLERATALVAVIHDDLTNIEIALTARAARPDLRVILRVFGEELDQNLERWLGPNTVFSASALAAPTYAAAAVTREVDYVLPVDGGLLGVTQIGAAAGVLAPAIEEQYGVRVLRRHDLGDRVTLLGPLLALEELRRAQQDAAIRHPSQPPAPTEQRDTVIVCGLGKVGYRVVRQLHRMRPRPRIVVVRLGDGRPEFPQHISRLDGVTALIGDARDPEVLRKAGVERATSVVVLTSDDLLNLQIGLAARRAHADVHVVLRVFSDVLTDRLADMFGIRTIYSTAGLASATLAAAALVGNVAHAFACGSEIFSTDQLVVSAGSSLAGQTIEQVRARHGGLVVALRRSGKTRALPSLAEPLQPGDSITLLAPIGVLSRMRELAVRG